MKQGAWIEAVSGRWHWIDDHADWIRRPECARRTGMSEEAVLDLAAMPRCEASGPERTAIILEAMKHGLIRFRGHGGAEVTFETILPLAAGPGALWQCPRGFRVYGPGRRANPHRECRRGLCRD